MVNGRYLYNTLSSWEDSKVLHTTFTNSHTHPHTQIKVLLTGLFSHLETKRVIYRHCQTLWLSSRHEKCLLGIHKAELWWGAYRAFCTLARNGKLLLVSLSRTCLFTVSFWTKELTHGSELIKEAQQVFTQQMTICFVSLCLWVTQSVAVLRLV